ncbi:MAG: hypothetical protein WCP69_09320 [Bacteroidota bacterium]
MQIKKFKICYFFYLLIFSISISPLNAQQKRGEKLFVDSINKLAFIISRGNNDIEKLNANEVLIETLYNTLINKDNQSISLDSLKNISFITPPDNAFKLITWTLKKEDGNYENFGILQTKNPKTNRTVIFTLKDKSEQYYNAENMLGDAENWFGAVYYKVLTSTINRKKYYTLLGWNGYNNFKQRKIIEILSFKANGSPVFGSKIFKKYTNRNAVRVVFEYSKKASMTLIYDVQTYFLNTKQRDPKTKRLIKKEIKSEMIVFDRLAPLNESMSGVNEYYVPETNIMDAFIPFQGRWSFIQDIEARNPQPNKPKTKYTNTKRYTPAVKAKPKTK